MYFVISAFTSSPVSLLLKLCFSTLSFSYRVIFMVINLVMYVLLTVFLVNSFHALH